MTIAEHCASCFEPEIWARGLSLHQLGQVTVNHADDAVVMAIVQPHSGSRHEVVLEFDLGASDIEATCTCQDYGSGKLCHHIWATILAVDEAGWLQDMLPLLDALIVSHQDDSLVPGDDGTDERKLLSALFGSSRAFERRRAMPAPRRQDSRPPAKKAPTWKEQMRTIIEQTTRRQRQTGQAPPHARQPRRQAWYVWNVGMSLQAGGLFIDYYGQERRKNGTFGKIKPQGVAREDVTSYEDPADQRLLQLLLGHEPYDAGGGYSRYTGGAPSREKHCVVAPIMYDQLLPELCATGRFVRVPDHAAAIEEAESIEWNGGAPWQFKLLIEADDQRQSWRVHGQLVRGNQAVPLREAVLLLADGLVLFPGQVYRLEARLDFSWIAILRKVDEWRIPYADRDTFLQLWWSAPALPKADLPPELDLPTESGTPTGTLTVFTPPPRFRDNQLYANVAVHYAGHQASLDTFQAGIVDLESQRVMLRDGDAEAALLQQLSDQGLRPNTRHVIDGAYTFASRKLPLVTEALLHSGWVVEADGVRMRPPGTMTFRITSGIDWFELHGHVDFGGVTASLPTLLRAIRQGERYVLLDDGSRGMLPEAWLARYGPFADLGHGTAETIRFKPTQALLLEALLAEQQNVSIDRGFQRWRDQLRRFDGIEPASPSTAFEGRLRPYQHEGLGWLYFLRDFHVGGCLADDMGLGKTVQVLALLASRQDPEQTPDNRVRPSIVVVPRSLVFNWMLEAARFTPTLRFVNYTGPNRSDLLAQLDATDVLVTTYGTLRRDIFTLKDVHFDYAILDEAQAIKNPASQVAKASRLLRADHRLALSGTPVENHPGELWSLFEFLNPGMLGRSTVFNRLTKNGDAKDDTHLSLLAKAIRPFMLRRTKTQVLTDLPDKTEQTIFCEMPGTQRQFYDELRDYYRTHLSQHVQAVGLQRAKIRILEALLRLRQAACHPGLIDANRRGDRSAKVEVLLEQLEAVTAEGHKALVFSQFTSLLAIVRTQLDARGVVYAYLDGRTRKRQERVERFQQDATCGLFLISLKAGGHGLNLTAADYVFILDPWWNPAVEAQAIDRAHRIGQTRRVFAYQLISRDTVEEKIVALQQSKRELAESIVAADAHVMRHLNAEDLQLLLS